LLYLMRRMLGDPPNPEDVGEYEGYKLNLDQNMTSYNNLPFVPGYETGGSMSDWTIDNNIMHQGFEFTVPNHTAGVPHLYVHEQYGLTQMNLTYNYLRNMSDQRPNIYSQSVWPSAGFLGGSFAQPLEISWTSVKNSISMAMMMGLNGFNSWVTHVCGVEMSAT
jgi:alpha-glucosidase (family GH31 glycosyl hydrolase)